MASGRAARKSVTTLAMATSSLKQGTRTAIRCRPPGSSPAAPAAIPSVLSIEASNRATFAPSEPVDDRLGHFADLPHHHSVSMLPRPCMRSAALAVIVPFESHSSPSIAALIKLVAPDMERVNTTILSRTGSEVTMIPEIAQHLIESGGKRLRPMLTLAMAQLAGYGSDGHIKLAAAVEFMHTATLLHDDVVDESEMRRGRLAARMLWGNEASVLVGDFLLGQAFKMMVEVGSLKALEILSSAAAVIAEGEVMQLALAKNTATTEDEY